jgi:hypothetical protein
MILLTKEQADTLDQAEAEKALKLLSKTYSLDLPINECWQEVWPDLDEIVNTLLYLEDRIDYLKMIDNVTRANQARWSTDKA